MDTDKTRSSEMSVGGLESRGSPSAGQVAERFTLARSW